ncbi:MAG: uroporphyrinogen decarboxylase family protein [Pseudoflavonifractor sp.]|nr:uroporphyrinogen decarboxylase family protein [Pseudoflavonifractor sp.]
MTKRERFMKFLANEPVDRVPVAFFHHFCNADEWFKGLESEEVFEKNIEGHRKSREVFDPDVIKIMNDSLMIMPLDTSFVEKASDLRRIQPPTMDSEFMKKTKELTQRSRAIYAGSDAPIYATGFSPAMIIRTSLSNGLDLGVNVEKPRLVEFLEEDPDSVVASLDIIAETIMALNEMLIKECSIDGIYFSVNNQSHYVPDDLYVKYIAPSEKKVMAHANTLSNINLLHVCGYHGKGNNLELFKDYEAAAINWAVHAEGVSLSEGKKLFGGKPVFGGFEQATDIYTGTREEIEAHTFRILDEAGTVGIMIGADCTVPTDIDDNHLEWVRQACIKYAAK